MTTTAETAEWISAVKGQTILNVGARAMRTLMRDGTLTVLDVPGSFPKVLRSEVEALARRSLRQGRLAAEQTAASA